MTFADLVAGDHVFLDANTLVYHFGPHPALGAAVTNWCTGSRNESCPDPRPRTF